MFSRTAIELINNSQSFGPGAWAVPSMQFLDSCH